jgi:predicted metal-dependent hydrolase
MNSIQILLFDDLEIEIHRKKVKHIYLKLDKTTAKPIIVASNRVSQKLIQEFIQSKLNWIKKHQTSILSRKISPPKKYESGEFHSFFGKEYELRIEFTQGISSFTIVDDCFLLKTKPDTETDKIQWLIERFYREQLNKEIPLLIAKWEPIMKVKVNEFGIKKMKTKWGTCNILAKRIWLNLELAKRPYQCLEYVVVHEMVHLLERNHTPRFHAFMTQFLPNWKESKLALNERRIDF